MVQVPLNVFDRRIISSGWLHKLAGRDVSVIARSVFLQGILLANFNDLPNYFHNWAPNFETWIDFYQRSNLSYPDQKFTNENSFKIIKNNNLIWSLEGPN